MEDGKVPDRLGGAADGTPVADGVVEFETEVERVFGEGLAMDDSSVGAQIAAKGAHYEVLIQGPKALGRDASTMTADIDGLAHFESDAVRKVQANKHPLRDAGFGALAGRGIGHGRTNAPIISSGAARAIVQRDKEEDSQVQVSEDRKAR